jgi:hypothetical protein
VVVFSDDSLDGAALGEAPLPWLGDLPAELRPDAFGAELTEISKQCDPDAFVRVDCSEPPCLAVFLEPDGDGFFGAAGLPGSGPTNCEQWKEKYGDNVTMSSRNVLCADGSTHSLLVLGPYLPEVVPETSDPEEGMRHLQGRVAAAADGVGCSAPATLSVENRLGYQLQWVPK